MRSPKSIVHGSIIIFPIKCSISSRYTVYTQNFKQTKCAPWEWDVPLPGRIGNPRKVSNHAMPPGLERRPVKCLMATCNKLPQHSNCFTHICEQVLERWARISSIIPSQKMFFQLVWNMHAHYIHIYIYNSIHDMYYMYCGLYSSWTHAKWHQRAFFSRGTMYDMTITTQESCFHDFAPIFVVFKPSKKKLMVLVLKYQIGGEWIRWMTPTCNSVICVVPLEHWGVSAAAWANKGWAK